MPEINQPTSMGLKIGESIKMSTPAPAAQSTTEEKTSAATIKPEESAPIETVSEEAAPQEETTDEFVSGSTKARKLGERQRRLAEMSLKNASKDEVSRQDFIKEVTSDTELEKYYKKHFAKEWSDFQVAGKDFTPEERTEEKIRLQLMAEDLRLEKEETSEKLAVRLGFTATEAAELTDMATKLEGTKIGGKDLDWNDALLRSARIIRPDKAKVGITALPSKRGQSNDEATKTEAEHERLVDLYRGITGMEPDRERMLGSLKKVDQGFDPKTGRFVMPMK